MRVVLINGTWGLDTASGTWTQPNSPFIQFLASQGIEQVAPTRPFEWSTRVDGLNGTLEDWIAGGANLLNYLVPVLCEDRRIPGNETFLIAHSHGLQVVLYAAQAGLKIQNLISVCSPARFDVMKHCPNARANIAHWTHLYSNFTDYMEILGELGNGHFGFVRKQPWADVNDYIPDVGHHGLLTDEKNFPLWVSRGWLPAPPNVIK